jgi:hypothetical protein
VTLTILDDIISSDRTPHTARPASGGRNAWEVSWLPGRHMDRNSAITAIVLADLTGPRDMHAGHRHWLHVEGWAAELALTAPEALTQIANPPSWADAAQQVTLDDPEAAE